MTNAERLIASGATQRLKEIAAARTDLDAEEQDLLAVLRRYGNGEAASLQLSLTSIAPAPDRRQRNGESELDPNTKIARFLKAARFLIEQSPDRVLSFSVLFNLLPAEVVPLTKNAREVVRSYLMKAGHRVGIIYESAEAIRLKESVGPQPIG